MKTMTLALLLTAFLMPGISYAKAGDHHGHHQRMMERMDQELELSDDQRSRIEAVFKEQHERFRTLRKETKTKLEAILSDEQQAKWEQMKAERKARWEKKREEWKKNRSTE